MRNEEIRWKTRSIINLLDGWLDDIRNEKEPVCDLPHTNDAVNYAYQAGAYKARAEINARRLQRIRDLMVENFDVQLRVKKV